jgi:plastocyanin
MRRIAVLAAMVAAVVAVPVLQRALADGDPRVAGSGCQPSPTNPPGLVPGSQHIHCTYGPLTVSPGNNLILVGPVTVENPHAEGYITRFAPNLVDATTGQVPPIHVVHLHHGVWLNTTRGASDYVPFMATGEEKTVGELPAGYGYPTHPWDTWIANYMLHNLTPATFEVFLTYDLDFIPSGTPAYNQTKAVEPVWLDVVSHCGGSAAYPVYNPSNSGPDPVVADPTAPSGQSTVHTCTKKFSVNKEVELVWMGGHVHPGGVRDELHAESCSSNPAAVAGSPLLFNSRAVLNSQWRPSGYTSKFGSWDFSMTTTNTTSSPWRWHMNAGDQLSVKTVYDSGHPWYEAMGIMFGWAHVIAPGEQAETPACTVPGDTGGTPSGNIAQNPTPVFGGSAPLFDPKQTYGQSGTATTSIDIYGFDYHPGGTGQAPVSVHAGDKVTFTNEDAYASIYHTVTSCGSFDVSALAPTTDACNLDYGQAYPLATWPSQGGFDTSQGVGVDASGTGELGWGLPGVTAAANYNTWSFQVPKVPAGTVYPFYCRVHPSMRGSLKVVS